MPRHIPTEEEKVFGQLVGLYQGCATNEGQCQDSFMWNSVNSAMDKLVARGHAHYDEFKMEPNNYGGRHIMNYGSIKAQLMSTLHRMSDDFDLADPAYEIFNHLPKTGQHISAFANSSPVQTNRQSAEMSVELSISTVIKEIEDNLSSDQVNALKAEIEALKEKPNNGTISQFINKLLDLGVSVSVPVLTALLKKQLCL